MKKCYSNSESSEYDEEPDEVNYFFWTKIDKRITKAKYSVGFDDAVVLMKEQLKVLKEHIYVKRVQNSAYNQHKNSLTNDELLVHVDFAGNYRNDQQHEIQSAYFGHESLSLFTSCCYYKDEENNLQQKSIVVVTENSDHNRVTSMSSLKAVVEIAESRTGKKYHRLIVWSDGMGTQFRSRFVFKISGTLFPEKEVL